MRIQRLKLPNGKELLLLISVETGIKCYQRDIGDWEPFDFRILDNVQIPTSTMVAQVEIS